MGTSEPAGETVTGSFSRWADLAFGHPPIGCFRAPEAGKGTLEVASMEKTRYDVVPSDGGWAVETGGKSTPAFPSKELAISAATARAQQDSPADVIVHSEDGTIEEEKTV